MATTTNVKVKGSSTTVKCTIPQSQCKRFGITAVQNGRGEMDFGSVRHDTVRSRWVKRMTEGMSTLRQLQKVSMDTRLPSPVRSAIKYFSIPFVYGGERRDRIGYNTNEGDNPAKKVLKV
jgi:hypothetical protein